MTADAGHRTAEKAKIILYNFRFLSCFGIKYYKTNTHESAKNFRSSDVGYISVGYCNIPKQVSALLKHSGLWDYPFGRIV